MTEKQLRAAISQARENESNSNVFVFQVFVAAGALGF